MQELTHLRTQTSKTYKKEGESYRVVASIDPIHYKHSSGIFLPIDNNLRSTQHPDYDFENTANDFTVFFKANINQDRAIAFYHNEAMVYFTPVGLGWYDAAKDKLEIIYKPSDTDCQVEGHKISFTNLYPNTKAGFVVTPTGFKEYFEVADPFNIPNPLLYNCNPESSYLVLVNHMEYDGVDDICDRHGIIEQRELDNHVYFLKNGLPNFFNPNLVGIDSDGVTTDLKKVFKVLDGKDSLIHGIDYNTLMTSPNYPYIIDTAITVYNAELARTVNAEGNWYGVDNWQVDSEETLSKGERGGVDNRAAVRFPNVNLPSGATINSALLTPSVGWSLASLGQAGDIWTYAYINAANAISTTPSIIGLSAKTSSYATTYRFELANGGVTASINCKECTQELVNSGAQTNIAYYSMCSLRPTTDYSGTRWMTYLRTGGVNTMKVTIDYTDGGVITPPPTTSTSSLFFAHA